MKFLEGFSGKKKSLILAIIGIIGLALIIFGTFSEKEDKEISKNTEGLDIAFPRVCDFKCHNSVSPFISYFKKLSSENFVSSPR